MSESVENKKIKPSELFSGIKDSLGVIDKMTLKRYIAVANKLLAKAEISGQYELKKRLEFRIQTLQRELAMLKNFDIKQYVLRDDVFRYTEETEAREVKISSVQDYMREIPDEAVDIIANTRECFDDFLVMFTDYTGETAKQADQLVIERDPILFGIFYDSGQDEVMERFYYLYDWEDEYCDLTLDKLIMEYKEITGEEIVHFTETNITKATKDLKKEANELG